MTKDQIIDRLLHNQSITPEEAQILRVKEIEYVPLSPYVTPEPQQQFQEIFKPKPKEKNPFNIEFQKSEKAPK